MTEITDQEPPEFSEKSIQVLSNEGERFVPTLEGEIAFEHFHRYLVAKSLCAGKVVVDIACGEGYGSALLAKVAKRVFGFDISEEIVSHARHSYTDQNLTFMKGDAHNIPLRAKASDVVVSFETIEHIADPDRFLSETRRVLNRGGLLIVSTPDKEQYNRGRKEPNKHQLNELYRDQFEILLKKHFKNVAIYGQQYFEGSVVFDGPQRRGFWSRKGSNQPRMLFSEDTQAPQASRPSPTFLLAVASDGALPELPLSLFASGDHPQLFKERYIALNDELEGRTQWLRRVQAELERTRTGLQAQIASAQNELEVERGRHQTLLLSHDTASDEIGALKARVELLEKQLGESGDRLQSAEAAKSTLETELAASQNATAESGAQAERQVSEAEQRARVAELALDQRDTDLHATRDRAQLLAAEKTLLEERLAGIELQLCASEAGTNALEAQFADLQKTAAQSLAEADVRVAEQEQRVRAAEMAIGARDASIMAARDEAQGSAEKRDLLEKRLADAETRLQAAETEKKSLETQYAELQRTFDRFAETAAQAIAQRSEELDAARGLIRSLQEQETDLQNGLVAVGVAKSTVEGQFAEAERQLQAAEAAKSAVEGQFAEAERQLQAAEAAKSAVEGQLAETKRQLQAAEAARTVLEETHAELKRLLSEKAETLQSLAAEHEQQVETTAATIETLQAQVLEAGARFRELESASQTLTQQVEERTVENTNLSNAVAEISAERDVLRARDSEMAGRVRSLETELSTVQSLNLDLRHDESAVQKLLDNVLAEIRKFAFGPAGGPSLPRSTKKLLTAAQDPAVIAAVFDLDRYLKRNPDVAEAGVDPVGHYLADGWKEGRVHTALFDDEYYLAVYPELRDLGIPPLYHYCTVGWREGRDPSVLFDTNYYLDTYPEVENSGLDPLAHFIHRGLGDGRRPNAQIDPVAFLKPEDMALPAFDRATKLAERIQASAAAIQGISLPSTVNPDVSVIIPVHNKLDYTQACLKSIERALPAAKFEVIVVDDASRDLTPLVVPSWMGVTYVRNYQNQGFVGSCNRGASVARGAHLLFLNNDTEVTAGWLDELLKTYERHGNVGVVGSKLVYPDGTLQEAGGIIWEDGSGWNYGRGDDPNKPEYNYVRDVDYVSGASLMIRRDLFWAIGGFDRRYRPAYFEDADLAFSARKLGYRVLYQPLSRIVHHEGISAGTDIGAGMKRHQVLNHPKFMEKWGDVLKGHLPNAQTPHIARERTRQYRVLMIDATTPTPDLDAGSVTQSYTIQVLQELGCKVTFIPEDNFAHIGKYTYDLQRRGVEVIHAPYATSVADHLNAHGGIYDLIMPYKAPRIAKYFDDLRKLAPQAKIITSTADLHFLRMIREAEVSGSKSKMKEALATRELEFDVMRRSDCTIIVSSEEMALLGRELPEAKLAFISLILEAPGRQADFDQLKDICFLGGFQHTPNADAVLYFHREIWPLIRQRLPGVRFRIMGSHPPDEILALAGDAVIVDGYVENLATTLGRCRISMAPLRFGAGVKGKIGNSLGHGIPVVTTSIGSEGMGLTHDHEIMVADDPVVFAENVCRLYEDRVLWTKLSDNGVAFIRREYSIEAAKGHFKNILRLLSPGG